MLKIESLEFNESCLKAIENHKFGGKKWPVVYIINNDCEAYVGETTDAVARINNHLLNPERASLNKIHLISDEEFNKSATLDIESSLIKYMASDGKYKLQNGNMGLRYHHYYQEQNYQDKFKELWKRLLNDSFLVRNNIQQIDNSDLFKYSPYKSLSDDQYRADLPPENCTSLNVHI